MLPNSTNRYGDVLRDLFAVLDRRLTDPNAPPVSSAQLDTLRRIFNELSDRDLRYRSLLGIGERVNIHTLQLGESIEPLSTVLQPAVFAKAYHATDTSIADATFTTVSFNQNVYGNKAAFQLDTGGQKIYLRSKAKAFFCTLAHAWEANGAGVRRADLQYFDGGGALIGTALFQVTGGVAVEENWFTATRLADLPDTTDYIQCRVKQTSGGPLHLAAFSIDLHIV